MIRVRNLESNRTQTTPDVWMDGECTTSLGSGDEADPRRIQVDIDADAANQLECTEDGLFVGGGQNVGWDAVVDNSIVASDPDARLFMGIGEALAYLDGLGMTNVAVAVRASATIYTETANWATPNWVHLYGIRGGGASMGLTSGLGTGVKLQWEWDGFQPSSQPEEYDLENFTNFSPSPTSAGAAFPSIPIGYLRAANCYIEPTHQSGSFGLCQNGYFEGCTFRVRSFNSTGVIYCNGSGTYVQCDIEQAAQSGGTQNWVPAATSLLMVGCRIQCATSGTHNLNMPVSANVELTYKKARQPTSTPTGISRIDVAASSRTRLVLNNETLGSNQQMFIVTAASAFLSLHLFGECQATITGSHSTLVMDGTCQGSWDITGPATIASTAFAGALFILRGSQISAVLSGSALTGNSGTFLTFTACDFSTVYVGASGAGTTATRKSYALDASCDKNILNFAGDTTFPVVGTDAGTANLVTVT